MVTTPISCFPTIKTNYLQKFQGYIKEISPKFTLYFRVASAKSGPWVGIIIALALQR